MDVSENEEVPKVKGKTHPHVPSDSFHSPTSTPFFSSRVPDGRLQSHRGVERVPGYTGVSKHETSTSEWYSVSTGQRLIQVTMFVNDSRRHKVRDTTRDPQVSTDPLRTSSLHIRQWELCFSIPVAIFLISRTRELSSTWVLSHRPDDTHSPFEDPFSPHPSKGYYLPTNHLPVPVKFVLSVSPRFIVLYKTVGGVTKRWGPILHNE